MIDPFHLEAYGKTTVNYNRDVEIFPVLNAIFEKIQGKSPYRSPTDMGTNRGLVKNCRFDGSVTGVYNVGGIAGENYGTIRKCSARKKSWSMNIASSSPFSERRS